MYGLLMLLPQSDAFKTLHARLHSVPTMALLKLEGGLQEPEQQPQNCTSPGQQCRDSRQQSLRDRNSLDAGKPPDKLIDFDQLLQSFQQQQVQVFLVNRQLILCALSLEVGSCARVLSGNNGNMQAPCIKSDVLCCGNACNIAGILSRCQWQSCALGVHY